MTPLKEGDKAPAFTLPAIDAASDETNIKLSTYLGQKVVLYFYPKDNTPGCTQESCDFRDHIKEFEKLGVQILGVSKDSLQKHRNFKEKYDLSFPLLSDQDGDVCERYGVWVEKNMYGRKYWGIARTTFLIDEEGRIAKIWPKVKVKDHVAAVRAAVETLTRAA